jgi:peptidoglycan/LPS O-acetylase OafA/YrhL
MNYRKEIDGLRAVAVMPVILFHAGFTYFSGGYVGVDVFFVISGYLITSILLRELDQGGFSILRFYERRARRILPALVFVMVSCIPFALAWMVPYQIKLLSQGFVAVTLFASNILFWKKTGYFSPDSENNPLLHTWSLAVEEQYYLFFPLYLLFVWRFGRNPVFYTIVIFSIISLLLSEWGWRYAPKANFYLAPFRAWELLAGSICAFLHFQREERASNLMSVIGLALIIFSIFYYDESTPFPSLYALAPVVGTAFIILFAQPGTWVANVLSLKFFVGVGLVSYSAYLWHQPIFAFARIRSQHEPTQWFMLGLSILTFVLAYITWRYVERPFRKRPFPALQSRAALFRVAGAVGAVFLALGVYGHVSGGLKSKFTTLPRYLTIESEFAKISNGWCFYSVDSLPDLDLGPNGLNCSVGSETAQKRGALIGDSFAGQFEPFWDIVGNELGIEIQSITTNWCYPSLTEGFTGIKPSRSFEQCLFNRQYIEQSLQDFDFLIVGAHWAHLLEKSKIDEVIEFIDFATEIGKPVIVMPSPELFDRSSFNNFIYRPSSSNELKNSHSEKTATRANQLLSEKATQSEKVLFLDRDTLFTAFGVPSAMLENGIPYSADGSHISVYGSKSAAKAFIELNSLANLRELIN